MRLLCAIPRCVPLPAAGSIKVGLPLTSTVRQMPMALRNQGKGDLDHSAIVTFIEEMAGVEVKIAREHNQRLWGRLRASSTVTAGDLSNPATRVRPFRANCADANVARAAFRDARKLWGLLWGQQFKRGVEVGLIRRCGRMTSLSSAPFRDA
jgi:hypothetical protein